VVAALPSACVEVVEAVTAVLHAVEGGDGLLGAVEGAELGEARLERGARGVAGGRDGGGGALGEEEGELGVGGGELAQLHDCAHGPGFIYRAGEIRCNALIRGYCNKASAMSGVLVCARQVLPRPCTAPRMSQQRQRHRTLRRVQRPRAVGHE